MTKTNDRPVRFGYRLADPADSPRGTVLEDYLCERDANAHVLGTDYPAAAALRVHKVETVEFAVDGKTGRQIPGTETPGTRWLVVERSKP
jgi:hypothetical protein